MELKTTKKAYKTDIFLPYSQSIFLSNTEEINHPWITLTVNDVETVIRLHWGIIKAEERWSFGK